MTSDDDYYSNILEHIPASSSSEDIIEYLESDIETNKMLIKRYRQQIWEYQNNIQLINRLMTITSDIYVKQQYMIETNNLQSDIIVLNSKINSLLRSEILTEELLQEYTGKDVSDDSC